MPARVLGQSFVSEKSPAPSVSVGTMLVMGEKRAFLTCTVTGLASARRRRLGPKIRFNRAVRRIVSSPLAVDLAAAGARVAPGVLRRAIRFAGDQA